MYDCLIIGSGPAGLTASIYLKRAGLTVAIISGDLEGGQLTKTTDIENFPGVGKISGNELMNNMKNQSLEMGTEYIVEYVKYIEPVDGVYNVITNKLEYKTRSIIIATGASPKFLGLESETYYFNNGGGISTCATCDGFFYKNLDVAVIGGGDTAFEEALYLSKICKSVTIVNRSNKFKASDIMIKRAESTSNITILKDKKTKEFIGDGEVISSVLLEDNKTKELSYLNVDGVFVAIGHKPNTDFLNVFVKKINGENIEFRFSLNELYSPILKFMSGGKEYLYNRNSYEKLFTINDSILTPNVDFNINYLDELLSNFINEKINIDYNGYITTYNGVMTNLPLIYAAGDVRDQIYRQAITSAADGCKAAMEIINKLH